MNERAATDGWKNRTTQIRSKFKILVLQMLINKFKRTDSEWD